MAANENLSETARRTWYQRAGREQPEVLWQYPAIKKKVSGQLDLRPGLRQAVEGPQDLHSSQDSSSHDSKGQHARRDRRRSHTQVDYCWKVMRFLDVLPRPTSVISQSPPQFHHQEAQRSFYRCHPAPM